MHITICQYNYTMLCILSYERIYFGKITQKLIKNDLMSLTSKHKTKLCIQTFFFFYFSLNVFWRKYAQSVSLKKFEISICSKKYNIYILILKCCWYFFVFLYVRWCEETNMILANQLLKEQFAIQVKGQFIGAIYRLYLNYCEQGCINLRLPSI